MTNLILPYLLQDFQRENTKESVEISFPHPPTPDMTTDQTLVFITAVNGSHF